MKFGFIPSLNKIQTLREFTFPFEKPTPCGWLFSMTNLKYYDLSLKT